MPPRIIPILDRLRQDIAAGLAQETIEEACRQASIAGGSGSSTRPPPSTSSCSRSSTATPPASTSSTSAAGPSPTAPTARPASGSRWPSTTGSWRRSPRRSDPRPPAASRWLGHRVWLVDGSSFSMPDEPELQAPLRPARQPAQGLRLPRGQVAGPVRPRHRHAAPLGAGAVADATRCRGPRRSPRDLEPGDVVLGDRGFCSYAHLALLVATRPARRCSASTRSRSSTSRPAGRRPRGGLEGRAGPAALAVGAGARATPIRSSSGPSRSSKPSWMTAEEYAALPDGDHGARAAVPGRGAGLPGARDHAGDDAAGCGGLPGELYFKGSSPNRVGNFGPLFRFLAACT